MEVSRLLVLIDWWIVCKSLLNVLGIRRVDIWLRKIGWIICRAM